ncbi:hypothetical protein IAT38_006570 [Cryptococcus sp. DSM 104549]
MASTPVTTQDIQAFLAEVGYAFDPSEVDDAWMQVLGDIVRLGNMYTKTAATLEHLNASEKQNFAIRNNISVCSSGAQTLVPVPNLKGELAPPGKQPLRSWAAIQKLTLKEIHEWIAFYEIKLTGTDTKRERELLVLHFLGGDQQARPAWQEMSGTRKGGRV